MLPYTLHGRGLASHRFPRAIYNVVAWACYCSHMHDALFKLIELRRCIGTDLVQDVLRELARFLEKLQAVNGTTNRAPRIRELPASTLTTIPPLSCTTLVAAHKGTKFPNPILGELIRIVRKGLDEIGKFS